MNIQINVWGCDICPKTEVVSGNVDEHGGEPLYNEPEGGWQMARIDGKFRLLCPECYKEYEENRNVRQTTNP